MGITDRLLKHIEQDDAELKAELEESLPDNLEKAEEKVEEEKEASDPLLEEEYTFDFEYKNAHGKTWTGKFKNKILTIAELSRVGALESMLNDGRRYESIPPLVRATHHAIAHMTFSLQPSPRPKWAENLRQLHDTDLVFELFAEVAQHQDRFLGRPAITAESEGI